MDDGKDPRRLHVTPGGPGDREIRHTDQPAINLSETDNNDPLSWFRRLIAEATPGPMRVAPTASDGRRAVVSGAADLVSCDLAPEDARLFATLGSVAPAVLALLEAAEKHLVACRCGDSGCVHGASGMCTNGVCTCFLEQPGLAERARLRRRQTGGNLRRATERVLAELRAARERDR